MIIAYLIFSSMLLYLTSADERSDADYLGTNIICADASYCTRQRELYNATKYQDTTTAPRYQLETIDCSEYALKVTLALNSDYSNPALNAPTKLNLTAQIYSNGVMRVIIQDDTEDIDRFQISDHLFGEEWFTENMQLMNFGDDYTCEDDMGQGTHIYAVDRTKTEVFDFDLQYNPFRIVSYSNSQDLVVLNNMDTLFFEKTSEFTPDSQSISLGFFLNANNVYGIPARGSTFNLNNTDIENFDYYNATTDTTEPKCEPYRMWNQDMFGVGFKSMYPNYGAIPYLLGHSGSQDAAVAWMNSAETWVDVFDYVDQKQFGTGKHVSFTSQGGKMEFFLLGSSLGPKVVNQQLSALTGYTPMPSLPHLGFHFSKYEENTAQMLIDRSDNFTKTGFPVDVIWSDIWYAPNNQYFAWDNSRFPIGNVTRLNQAIQQAKRRLVVITDPHVGVNSSYPVYANGKALQDDEGQSIFIKDPTGESDFVGACWPGESVWIDYLNENASDYWSTLYQTKNFIGQTYLYGAWNDMNEPSVFEDGSLDEIAQRGMPVNNLHTISADQDQVKHMFVHNAYGALQSRATYKGVLTRDGSRLRPFVLTRSYFFGSQRYTAMWNGDSTSDFGSVNTGLNQFLALGVSGMVNVGADIPGFSGTPSDQLAVAYYELAAFYPMFRAHSSINSTVSDTTSNKFNREPWLQSKRVQGAIRRAIKQRYQMFYMLYYNFYQAHTEGTPIIRPMWYEFPNDTNTFDNSQQFMWGNNLLIAPKLEDPSLSQTLQTGVYQMSLYLPTDANWYFYPTGKLMTTTGSQTFFLSDDSIGVFARAGSILPILDVQEDRMSLLEAVEDPIRLEIFMDPTTNTASGSLYLDDGLTFKYEDGVSTLVDFYFDGTDLTVTKASSGYWPEASNKMITEIAIYGYQTQPQVVYNTWVSNTAYPDQGNVFAFMNYFPDSQVLRITGLTIPVDNGKDQGESTPLIGIVSSEQ